MPTADFFRRLGLFVIKDFFDPESCARLRLEAGLASNSQAMVVSRRGERVDEGIRKTKQAHVSVPTVALVRERLLAVQPLLESHFTVTLVGCQGPEFLVYKAGDLFQAHSDSSDDPDYPDDLEYVKKRQVSVVIFLNGEAEAPGPESYQGGALTFYGLIDDSRAQTCGFPLMGEVGLLIAFRSNVFHEVTAVIQGERCTIVSWFF